MSDYQRQTEMKANYGLGPRMGNASARADKRSTFLDSKKERAGLADEVLTAFENRNWETLNTKHDPMVEPVHDEVRPVKRFRK